MLYKRTFKFSAAHFNSQAAYDLAWGMRVANDDELRFLLTDIHGHNFKVEVVAHGSQVDGDGFLVDDSVLEKIVMEYANINLSMHPDFFQTQRRATTELIAAFLLSKFKLQLGKGIVSSVTVHENEDISVLIT